MDEVKIVDQMKIARAIAVFDTLNCWEQRVLQLRRPIGPFNFDVLGNLPHELVVQVFLSLDFAFLFSHQRVCKKWRKLLSDPHIQRAVLREWTDDDSQKPCLQRAKTLQNVRRGKPVSTVELKVDLSGEVSLQHLHFLFWVFVSCSSIAIADSAAL